MVNASDAVDLYSERLQETTMNRADVINVGAR